MRNRRLIRSALLAFVLSRGLLFALLLFGSQMAYLRKVYDNSVWETQVHFRGERVLPELQRMLMAGDSWRYRTIALTSGSLQSISRYALVNFPLFLCMALAGRRPALDRAIVAASVALWGWMVSMLIFRVDFALA